ncbi:MAG: hypothetical protein ACI9DS_001873 [Glaciecola sp.]|jgi:hypothetical protein
MNIIVIEVERLLIIAVLRVIALRPAAKERSSAMLGSFTLFTFRSRSPQYFILHTVHLKVVTVNRPLLCALICAQ